MDSRYQQFNFNESEFFASKKSNFIIKTSTIKLWPVKIEFTIFHSSNTYVKCELKLIVIHYRFCVHVLKFVFHNLCLFCLRSDHHVCNSESCGPRAVCYGAGGCRCDQGYNNPFYYSVNPQPQFDSYGCLGKKICFFPRLYLITIWCLCIDCNGVASSESTNCWLLPTALIMTYVIV